MENDKALTVTDQIAGEFVVYHLNSFDPSVNWLKPKFKYFMQIQSQAMEAAGLDYSLWTKAMNFLIKELPIIVKPEVSEPNGWRSRRYAAGIASRIKTLTDKARKTDLDYSILMKLQAHIRELDLIERAQFQEVRFREQVISFLMQKDDFVFPDKEKVIKFFQELTGKKGTEFDEYIQNWTDRIMKDFGYGKVEWKCIKCKRTLKRRWPGDLCSTCYKHVPHRKGKKR